MTTERLPKGWITARLDEVVEPRRTKADPRLVPDLPFLGMEHLESQTTKLFGTVPFGTMRSTGVRFAPRDVLYGRLRPYLNKVHQARFDGVGSGEFIVLPENAAIDGTFLLYRLNAADFVDFASHLDGGDRPRVNFAQIGKFVLRLPPVIEQRRIVAALEERLSDLDAAAASLGRAALNAARYRDAVLDAAVSGLLTSKHETNERLPLGWRRIELGGVAQIQGGVQKQPKRLPTKNHYPFLRVANVYRGRLALTDIHRIELFDGELDRLRLRRGDLLIVEGNGSPTEIGRLAVWDGSITDCVHQNHIIRARPNADVLPEYLAYYWNSPTGTRLVRAAASSTSGLHTLSVAKVSRVPIPLPPVNEQHRIVAAVEARVNGADRTIAEIDVQLARAARLRQSLLNHAFEGKLVAQDPNDEPATVLLDRILRERAIPSTTPRREPTRRKISR